MDIQISDLHFAYPNGLDVLRGVSLRIAAGARVALLGQNGAGKTTLVKHLNGLLKPTRGSVRVGDWDTREHTVAEMTRRVGLVFQNPDDQLFKTRVWDEVAFGPVNLKFDSGQIEREVRHALDRCGLSGWEHVHPYDLPPWQRRWVAIASVLAMRPAVLVMDEPTTEQDANGIMRLVTLLDELQKEGITVIVITHDIDWAAEHFGDLVVMAQGQILARGDVEVLSNPEVLRRAGLEAPQLARLARELGWREFTATPEAFLARLSRRR